MRIITSQAIALPTQVLTWSANSRNLCVVIGAMVPGNCPSTKNEHHPVHRMVPSRGFSGSGLLRGRTRLGAEVVRVGHAAVHHDVLLPLDRALGEFLLRGDDLGEERVALGL